LLHALPTLEKNVFLVLISLFCQPPKEKLWPQLSITPPILHVLEDGIWRSCSAIANRRILILLINKWFDPIQLAGFGFPAQYIAKLLHSAAV